MRRPGGACPGKSSTDAAIPPVRILASHSQDHGADRGPHGWSPGSLPLEGPPPLDEISVPAQERAGGDEQMPATGRGEYPGQGADDGSIPPRRSWASNLTPQDGQLMTQHQASASLDMSERSSRTTQQMSRQKTRYT